MKKKLEEYFNEWRNVLRRERNSQNNASQEDFDKSVEESRKYVKKYKDVIVYDMACDWEEHKFRCKQADMEQAQESRSQRAERLIELGKSYKPAAPRPEKAEPGKSAEQQSPDSGGKMLKTNWGNLFAIYGDKPFMVREGEPYKNLFPDDPDRSYRSGKDFDIDRE